MPQSVVVGVDGSPASDVALDTGLAEAARRSLPLLVVRAWLAGAGGSGGRLAHPGEAEDLAVAQLKAAVDRVPGAASVAARATVRAGAAVPVLVEAGRSAALLVLGTRGSGPLGRTVLGSVSAAVLPAAPCPVLVVPVGVALSPRGSVLVGVDHSRPSLAALRLAVEQARSRAAVLVPVFVDETAPDLEGLHTCTDALPAVTAVEVEALGRAVAQAGGAGLRVRPRVVAGYARSALPSLAGPADLLVVGSRGRGAVAGLLLGSTSRAVVTHAPCAVLVVRG